MSALAAAAPGQNQMAQAQATTLNGQSLPHSSHLVADAGGVSLKPHTPLPLTPPPHYRKGSQVGHGHGQSQAQSESQQVARAQASLGL